MASLHDGREPTTIRSFIERARVAQQKFFQRHDVQLEISDPLPDLGDDGEFMYAPVGNVGTGGIGMVWSKVRMIRWASLEERDEEFRKHTQSPKEREYDFWVGR